MKYEIEQITADNRRPGTDPDHTYLTRYDSHPRFGWMCCRTFATLEEAEKFAATL